MTVEGKLLEMVSDIQAKLSGHLVEETKVHGDLLAEMKTLNANLTNDKKALDDHLEGHKLWSRRIWYLAASVILFGAERVYAYVTAKGGH